MIKINTASKLHEQVLALAPIYGLSIGSWLDKTTWSIQFKPEATSLQRNAAILFLDQVDLESLDTREALTKALDTALNAIPSIDPRIKAVFVEWRKQVS